LDKKKILKRGFSIIRDINNNIIYKKNHTLKNNDVVIELSDGKIKAKIS
jgi:exonuclease VII large subunit